MNVTVLPLRSRGWLAALALLGAQLIAAQGRAADEGMEHRYLYVATPGIRDYLEYGGHGLLVFDIDHGHRFVKRLPTVGLKADGSKPDNVKGISASAATGRIYIDTTRTLASYDLVSGMLFWEREYEGGCDRMAIAPDGKVIYVPSFEKDHWNIIDAHSGDVLAKIVPKSGSHNTVFGLDGKHVYLAGLRSPLLTIADAKTHAASGTVGPFEAAIRPFTVDGKQAHCFVNVNGLLGFEVGDLRTGKKLHRVEVRGYNQGPVKRHGCPSHGIGLTPDEKELWVADAANQRLHIFDATVMPPEQRESIALRDEPGWVTFSLDGRYAYPSTGEVIDVRTRKIVATLADENGGAVQSEKLLEVDFRGDTPIRNGDQFGLGRVAGP